VVATAAVLKTRMYSSMPLRVEPSARNQKGPGQTLRPLPGKVTRVVAVAELLAGSGSSVADPTTTVLVMVPGAVGTTTMVTATDAPDAMSPSAHFTTPA